jgi:hypothetical protein
MSLVAFFRFGAETPFLEGVKFETHPYSVSLNSDIFTLEDAELLLTSANTETLQDRVQPNVNNPHAASVDKFFKVQYENGELQALAVKTWSGLFGSCKKIQCLSGTLAIGLTLFALQGPSFYLIVASYVGVVASTCLFGWSLHRYHIAEKELAVWSSPGEDFAKKRKAALELPLHEMVKNKCYFRPNQPSSTLLGIEMLSVFRRDFKKFATPLLDKKCDTPEQQHQWVVDFIKGNPLWIEFFEDNPHLANKPVYHDVWKFREQIHQLSELINTLAALLVPQFNENQKAAKQKADDIKKNVLEKAETFCQSQKITALRAQLYRSRVLKVLNTECLDQLYALSEKEKTKAKFFCSIVYSQVRALLEEAKKGLLENKSYEFDEDVFAYADIFFSDFQSINKYFQRELDAITVSYPKNVIDKARAVAPQEETYQQFITAAFACPLLLTAL